MKSATVLVSAALATAFSGPPPVFNHHQLAKLQQSHDDGLVKASSSRSSNIKEFHVAVPVDHFHNDTRYEPHTDDLYNLRYFVDTSNYRPGGPVIVLHSGEFSAEGRLPFLEHGIVPLLTKEFGGVGLVMEHRYYGKSWPREDSSVENLRFLTVEQALADTAYFARNITFAGLEQHNLTYAEAPWIIYGGSYAGTVAAMSRKIYPEVWWGGISSSGVPLSVEDYWQYLEAARLFAPDGCAEATQKLTHVVDRILFGEDKELVSSLKELFHLDGLENDAFGQTIAMGIYGLQSTNWDPEVDEPDLGLYCGAVTSDSMLFASMRHRADAAHRFVKAAGYGKDIDSLSTQLLNWAGFIRFQVRDAMRGPCKGKSQHDCFSHRAMKLDPKAQSWETSWMYQTCIENGFFQTGSGVPKDQLPLVSRAVTLEYSACHCPNMFNITTSPDVDRINKYGGLDFSHDRLAHIDGAQDPWRAAGVHAIGQPDRESTTREPFMLVDWGVHHWEENDLAPGQKEKGLPPKQVIDAHKETVRFVGEWLKEWKQWKGKHSDEDDDDAPGDGEL